MEENRGIKEATEMPKSINNVFCKTKKDAGGANRNGNDGC
jgi:hypothetical protein